MALPQREISYSPEEYLAFERTAQTKHEYLDGVIYAMAGASPKHNQICFNTVGAFASQLKGTSCVGYTSDQKVRSDPADLFAYPDLTIVCGDPIFHDTKQDVMLNPIVIVEVLSPSTEEFDRKTKFERYKTIKSLTDYILISQTRSHVEYFTRPKGKRQWLLTVETELSAEIYIASIKCRLKLADIYDRVTFTPDKPALQIVKVPSATTTKKAKRTKAR